MTYVTRDRLGIYNGHATNNGISGSDHGPGPELMGADTLIGDLVFNHKDEELGEIKEIMLDMRNGKVGYAVMSFGGFLGMGEKYHPLPWSLLKYSTDKSGYVVNLSKDQLANAPNYDEAGEPDWSDRAYDKRVSDYYGAPPFWTL